MSELNEKGSLELDRFIDEAQMRIDISINITDLDSAIIEAPGLFIHYASKTVSARRQVDRFKNAAEILEAQLFKHHKNALTEAGEKATEATINAAIKTDPRYIRAYSKLVEAQSIFRMCEIAESAFIQRKDLILELCRDRRKEREGSLRVLSQQDARDGIKQTLSQLDRV